MTRAGADLSDAGDVTGATKLGAGIRSREPLSSRMDRHPASAGSRGELGRLLQAVLTSRGQANAVFDILAVLQVSGGGGLGAASGSHNGAQRHPVWPPASVRGP